MFQTSNLTLAVVSETPISFDGRQYLHSPSEGRYIDGLATAFKEVIIFTYAFRPGDLDYENTATYSFQAPNIRVIEIPLARPGRFLKLRKAWQMIQSAATLIRHRRGWDIAYIFFPGYIGAMAALFYRAARRPYMAYLGSDWPEEAELLIPFQGLLKRPLVPVFRGLVAALQNSAVHGSILTLTAGRLLSSQYAKQGANAHETIPRLMWDEFRIYEREDTCAGPIIRLLIVANLIERKGVTYVIEAVRLLRARTAIDFRCTVVGWGPFEDTLREQVKNSGLEEVVTLTGHQTGADLARHYREADIFAFASFSGEGFPRVLYEAMSQGLPIISTDICGISLKLKPNVHALYVPTKDAAAIAEGALTIVENPDLRRALIANGRAFMQAMIAGPRAHEQVVTLLKQTRYAQR